MRASPDGKPWTAPTQVAELVDLPTGLTDHCADFVPRLCFILDDITATPLPDLYRNAAHPAVLILRVLLKRAPKNRHLDRDLEPLLSAFAQIDTDDLVAFLRYIRDVGDTADSDLHPLFRRLGPDAEEAFMTTANMLRAEGRVEGQARVLLLQLTQRFGDVPTTVRTAIESADPTRLDEWTCRILTAETLGDMGIC